MSHSGQGPVAPSCDDASLYLQQCYFQEHLWGLFNTSIAVYEGSLDLQLHDNFVVMGKLPTIISSATVH